MAPLRASLARSPPRLGRSQAGGLHPRPPGLRPLVRLRAPGPCCLGHPAGGFRHGCAWWPGWSTACGCPRWTPSPWRFSGFGRNSKVGRAYARRGFGGVPPVVGRRWATRPRRWAARCSRRLCPPSTDWARLSTGDRVQGAAVEAVWLSLLKTRIKSAWPES